MDAAGFGRYTSATNYDWDAVNAFMAAAIAFVEANTVLLESNFNMPPTFVTDLKNFRDAFEPQVDLFLNTLENSEIGTQDKIQFNNQLYDEAIKVCEDGQVVFADNEAKRHQFVWDRIIDRITPPGAAGLKLDVRNAATNEFEPGVSLSIQQTGQPTVNGETDAEGFLQLTNLAVGDYTGSLRKPGFTALNIEFTISTGVISFKHYVMTPQAPEPEV